MTNRALRALAPSRCKLIFICAASSLALWGCSPDGAGQKIPNGDWAGYGRTPDESRFSPLTEIGTDSIGSLKPAWSVDLDVTNATSTPLAINGKIFVSAGLSVTYAIEGATGKVLWRYDPGVANRAGAKLRPTFGIRGLAYSDGLLFVGTHDGRLIAISADKGVPKWSVDTGIPGDTRFITGAPRIMGDLVIIGHGGSDTDLTRGYVTAYDRRTGRQAWRFYIVPPKPGSEPMTSEMAMAAKTWTGQWWKYGGGGTVWNAMTYDPELNTIYLGTGNGDPYNWKIRNPGRGDNLFLASIVALDAKTGKYKWHYQVNPNEAWDYNAAMDMITADLTIEGKNRKVLMQAPKNGFFYVLDRTNGKLISAEKIVEVTWADRIDLKTGRPVERPGIRYENGVSVISPSFMGAHSWYPMAYSPDTKLVYIPVIEQSARYGDKGIDPKTWSYKRPGFSGALTDMSLVGEGRTSLLAWDPVRQKQAWRVSTPPRSMYGVLATAGGLVFQGQADGTLRGYSAANGKIVWTANIGTPVTGPPISYQADGHQYIAFLVGPVVGTATLIASKPAPVYDYRSQPRRLIAYRIDGTAKIGSTSSPTAPVIAATGPISETVGMRLFGQCSHCHGANAVSAGGAPDLRQSPVISDRTVFTDIVKGGALKEAGMPQFEELSPAAIDSIRKYLLERRSQDVPATATELAPKGS